MERREFLQPILVVYQDKDKKGTEWTAQDASYCQKLWIDESKRRRTLGESISIFSQLANEAKGVRHHGVFYERSACETMVFKLPASASKGWRKLNGALLLPEILQGVKFVDGVKVPEAAA